MRKGTFSTVCGRPVGRDKRVAHEWAESGPQERGQRSAPGAGTSELGGPQAGDGERRQAAGRAPWVTTVTVICRALGGGHGDSVSAIARPPWSPPGRLVTTTPHFTGETAKKARVQGPNPERRSRTGWCRGPSGRGVPP